jgi:hypothetical protein
MAAAAKWLLVLLIVILSVFLMRPAYANLPVTPAPSPIAVPAGEGAGEQPREPFTVWIPLAGIGY